MTNRVLCAALAACALGWAFPAQAAIFQMADGRFYDTATGRIAGTQEELMGQVSAGTSTVVIVPGQESLVSTTTTVVPTPYLDAIENAQAELNRRIANERPAKPVISTREDEWRRVTVAVWDRAQATTTYHHAEKNGTKIRWLDDDAEGRVVFANGVNSTFRFSDPNKVVVAIRYPIYRNIGTAKKKKFEVQDVVYTPYSPALHVPEVIEAGKEHLQSAFDRVYASLDTQGVRSYASSGMPITAVVDRKAAEAVVIIEHSETKLVTRDPAEASERFYVVLGANKERSYHYSKSSAGALGIVQFMPTSYERFANIRPELGLRRDGFETAMRDQDNALKAQVAYLDYLMSFLPKELRASSTADLHEFAVAAYNGGPFRVKQSLEEWEEILDGERTKKAAALQSKRTALQREADALRKKILNEEDAAVWKPMQKKLNGIRAQIKVLDGQIASTNKGVLRQETIDYVLKYRHIQGYLQQETAVTTYSSQAR